MSFDTASTSNAQLVLRLVPLAYLATLIGSAYSAFETESDSLFTLLTMPWSFVLEGLPMLAVGGMVNTFLLLVVTTILSKTRA